MIALVVAALATGLAPDVSRADIAALRDAKLRLWPSYYSTNDASGLDAFLADGFVALGDDGSTETKSQVVAWVRANKWQNADTRFRYDIKNIAFYGADVANVYGTGSYDGRNADGACRMTYTSANIFVRDGKRWRPKFSHTSKAACASTEK